MATPKKQHDHGRVRQTRPDLPLLNLWRDRGIIDNVEQWHCFSAQGTGGGIRIFRGGSSDDSQEPSGRISLELNLLVEKARADPAAFRLVKKQWNLGP